jgi:hypothetical protein
MKIFFMSQFEIQLFLRFVLHKKQQQETYFHVFLTTTMGI